MATAAASPTLKARILAAIDAMRVRGNGLVLTSELHELNFTLGVSDEHARELALPNAAGHKTPLYVWSFKDPVFDALVDLFHEGELSVKIITYPGLLVVTSPYVSEKPLATDLTRWRLKKQHWVLMEVVRGLDPRGGHWHRLPDGDLAFHWNAQPSSHACPIGARDGQHVA